MAGLAALHPPGLLKVPGLDYCGFSPGRAVGPLSLGALGLGAACVCISYRCWSGLCGPGGQGSVQEKVTHCRGQKKKKPGEAGRRPPPLPAPLSCLGPGGISPFLGAWLTLTTCPFPLGKGPGLGVEAKKKESVTSSRGPRWDAVCTRICKCQCDGVKRSGWVTIGRAADCGKRRRRRKKSPCNSIPATLCECRT